MMAVLKGTYSYQALQRNIRFLHSIISKSIDKTTKLTTTADTVVVADITLRYGTRAQERKFSVHLLYTVYDI